MANASSLDFTTLRKGMVLGPDHHQFQLIKPVSNSPIGQVWHALDLSTGSDKKKPEIVALEIVNPVLLKDKALETFKRQVTLSKQLSSPHIAKTYGYFLSREGWLFVAMEPIATRSLARILREDGYRQLSVKKIRIILSQVATALDYAHNRQISHGDLTPWNIIITPGSGAKLVNFGFRQPLLQQIQKQGMRILNTEFHAPEAFDHIPLSTAADIFSFGCLAYQLFDGRPPFNPEEPLDSRDVATLEVPKQLTEEQWKVLAPALSETPGDRPSSATELVKALFPANQPLDQPVPEYKPAQTHLGKSAPSAVKHTNTADSEFSFKYMIAGVSLFVAGIALGYGVTHYYWQARQQQLFDKMTAVQTILAEPPSTENKIFLSQAFAEFKIISDNSEVIAAIQKQVNGYKLRIVSNRSNDEITAPILSQEQTLEKAPNVLLPLPSSKFIAGAVFKDEISPNLFGPNMVVIPSGKFTMGDRSRQGDDNELPAHRVSIKHPFALSQHEVTFRDYNIFALSTGRKLPDDEGWSGDDRPVINVSWNDANAYADWIKRQTKLPYRLPTEAEWEYAARAHTTTAFWWGNDRGRNKAVCDDCGSNYDGRQTAPAGSFKANPFGLYDMNGNVYEWVSDCYNATYEEAPKDGSSWNVGQCDNRVMRGGSWYNISRLIRSASRYRHPANTSRNDWGFRLALDLNSARP